MATRFFVPGTIVPGCARMQPLRGARQRRGGWERGHFGEAGLLVSSVVSCALGATSAEGVAPASVEGRECGAYRAPFGGDGSIEAGYLGTGWGPLATGSGLVYDGLDWLGLAIVGTRVVTRFGRGTVNDPPSSWTTLSNGDLSAGFTGGFAKFNQIGAYLTCYGAPASDVTFSFGQLRFRQRRIE